MGDSGTGASSASSAKSLEAGGEPRWCRASVWAAVGGMWGFASWFIGVLAMLHVGIFDDLFERTEWLLPARWAAAILGSILSSQDVQIPLSEMAELAVLALASIALGAGGALLAWRLARSAREALSDPPPG